LRAILLFSHLLGFVLWIGSGLASMHLGKAIEKANRDEVGLLLGLMGGIQRAMLLPGVVLTVVSGLLLTLRLYGGAISVAGYPVSLMVMQGAGLLGAGIAIGVTVPTTARLTRLDPHGPHAAVFASLKQRASISGMLTGVLAMVALVGGALMRS
jgi:hypothetical protein